LTDYTSNKCNQYSYLLEAGGASVVCGACGGRHVASCRQRGHVAYLISKPYA